jgi:dihydrofolate reductase
MSRYDQGAGRQHVELIASVGFHWELGNRGRAPWPHLPQVDRWWREHVSEKTVIWGRKTWERASESRRAVCGHNIILSRNSVWCFEQRQAKGIEFLHRAPDDHRNPDALAYALDRGKASGVIIAGGAEVYKQALELDLVDVIHLVVRRPDGGSEARWNHDAIFPALYPWGWVQHGKGISLPDGHRGHYVRLVRDPGERALTKDDTPLFSELCAF